jgi:hypothetical protein
MAEVAENPIQEQAVAEPRSGSGSLRQERLFDSGEVAVAGTPGSSLIEGPHGHKHSFFGADGVTSGYELEIEYLPVSLDASPEEFRVQATFKANGYYSDPYQIRTEGHCSVFDKMNEQEVLGSMIIEREITIADYVELRDRLTSIEAFSWEYDDEGSKLNVGRAFSQLFRAAALSEDLGKLLKSTPLGDMTVRQY